jgi:hypothetical protein
MENNSIALVDNFIKTYGTKVKSRESGSYVELMMDDHDCIEKVKISKKGKITVEQFYIPQNNSFYTEDDEFLRLMIIATFGL